MPASYPSSIKIWSINDAGFEYPQDLRTVVYARHVVTIYDEVTAIQQQLGAGGVTTGAVSSSLPTYSSSTTSWASLRERLLNIESGVFQGVTNRVSTVGGSTITSAGDSTVSLTVRAKSGQTANLLELRNSSGTIVTSVGPSGFIATIDGGSAV